MKTAIFHGLLGILILGSSALANAAPVGTYDLPDFKKLLDQNPAIRSIDDLIPQLPASYLGAVSFVYDSNSLQGASLDYPRVVSYGSSLSSGIRDHLIFAFKGTPGLPSKLGVIEDHFEFIRYNEPARTFEFYELVFDADENRPVGGPPTGDSNAPVFAQAPGRYKILGPNPAKCLGCHQSDPRPNWSRYPEWPGVYGSSDFHRHQSEYDGWTRFYHQNKPNGRYASLSLYAQDGFSVPTNSFIPSTLTNLRFDYKLDRMNEPRRARILHGTANYDRFKYAIYGALKGCADIRGFLPDSVASSLIFDLDTLKTDTQAKVNGALHQAYPIIKTYQTERVASLRYLMEGRGISIDGLYTNFPMASDNNFHETSSAYPSSYYFTARAIEGNAVLGPDVDPDLAQFIPSGADLDFDLVPDFSIDCAALRARSLSVLGS